jgi:hypothetical protein
MNAFCVKGGDKMIFKEGQEYKAFAANEIRENNIKYCRDFSDILKKDYVFRDNTRRGVLIIGLRSTGKSTGIYQATVDFPSDKIFFLAASSREENLSKYEVLAKLKEKDYDLIIIDEYSWLKETDGEKDTLASYLAGKAGEGVKVIISGSDSTKIHALLNTDFIHRAVQLNTTYFSYDEYCRIYELAQNDKSMKKFLTCGGIFENHAYETYDSLKEYIKTAIIEDLGAYYPQYDKELIEAAVYKIFYECVTGSYTKTIDIHRLAYEDFLDNFGIRTDIEIKSTVFKEIFYKLKEIGVVVILDDIKRGGRKRAYITNQTISAQLTKCIYGLDNLSETYMGNLYEASVVCYEYMQYAFDINSPSEMYYAETGKSDLEIEFIICDKRKAYLFECKFDDNDDLKLNDTASILQDEVRNLLGDRDLAGRYVIYQGHDKLIEQRGCAVICTNNWDINFEDFKKYKMFLQITNKLGFDIRKYNDNDDCSDVYEKDNIPNPFDKLSLEELLFLQENNYFLPK